MNNITSAEIYSSELDRVFEAKSATAFLADNALRTRFVGAKTVLIPDVQFEGLHNYDRNGGFKNGAVTVQNTSYTMNMDRARSLQIDREDMDEAGIASLAGKILGEYVRTKVVPECDAYVLSKLGSLAMNKGNLIEGDLATPYDTFCKLVNEVQAVAGYDTELVCFMDSSAYASLCASDEIGRMITVSDFKQGEVNLKVKAINGIAIIPVVSERMKTAFTFEDGGFKPADTSRGIHMLVMPKTAAHLVKKSEKMRIFTPEQNVDADAYKFDYRIYYDVFVKATEADTIWAWVTAPVIFRTDVEDYECAADTEFSFIRVEAITSPNHSINYQWYRCDDRSGRGAVKLEEGNAAEYFIDASYEPGIYYFFCKIMVDGVNPVKSSVCKVTVIEA